MQQCCSFSFRLLFFVFNLNSLLWSTAWKDIFWHHHRHHIASNTATCCAKVKTEKQFKTKLGDRIKENTVLSVSCFFFFFCFSGQTRKKNLCDNNKNKNKRLWVVVERNVSWWNCASIMSLLLTDFFPFSRISIIRFSSSLFISIWCGIFSCSSYSLTSALLTWRCENGDAWLIRKKKQNSKKKKFKNKCRVK